MPALEKTLGDCERAVAVRRRLVEEKVGTTLEGLPYEGYCYDQVRWVVAVVVVVAGGGGGGGGGGDLAVRVPPSRRRRPPPPPSQPRSTARTARS